MKPDYHIIYIEDSPDDAEFVERQLRGAPFRVTLERVEAEDDFLAALAKQRPDLVLCDYHLPRFNCLRALELLRERLPAVPLIVVSHQIGEDAAVEALRSGAVDYLLKSRMGRLEKAIENAIEQSHIARDKAAAEAALQDSELQKRTILNSLGMRIALLDGAGIIIGANKAWDAYGKGQAQKQDNPCVVGTDYLAYLNSISAQADYAASALEGIRSVLAHELPFLSLEYQGGGTRASNWYVMRVFPIEEGAPGAVVAHEDISDRMLTQVALRTANRRLQALSKRVLTIQEQERRTISRNLHDDVGQTLTALKISLHMLSGISDQDRAAKLAAAIAMADGALDTLRQMALDLHPPQLDQLGLADALKWLADRQSAATGLQIACHAEGLHGRLPDGVETACFRIVQEALSNASRHARAKNVGVRVEQSGQLVNLTIHDDGIGFDADAARARALSKGSLGLISMEERAELAGGRLKLRSVPGAGTTLSATFPIASAPRLNT